MYLRIYVCIYVFVNLLVHMGNSDDFLAIVGQKA